jgi:hypothetical protein
MRDPNRIDRMIEKLWALWKTQPDMRLGQLLVNVVRPTRTVAQLFGVEDDFTEKQLNSYPNPNADRYPEDEVTLGLTGAKAMVLLGFLLRLRAQGKLKVEHQAETQILHGVCALLEQQLADELRDPEWRQLLDAARRQVQDSASG